MFAQRIAGGIFGNDGPGFVAVHIDLIRNLTGVNNLSGFAALYHSRSVSLAVRALHSPPRSYLVGVIVGVRVFVAVWVNVAVGVALGVRVKVAV